MKKILPFLFLTILISACETGKSYTEYKDVENTPKDYSVIPLPVRMNTAPGRFVIDEHTRIVASDSLVPEANFLSQLLSGASGFKLETVTSGKAGDHVIILKLDSEIQEEEGYKLSVTYDQIKISGKTSQGVFYGIQSLRLLMPAEAEVAQVTDLTIPAVEIEDAPRFSYRGMHLDVARHMFPLEFIKKYIDLLALHKMNRFHWHLTEDQGWRIEIKKYPKLTEIGSVRKGTMVEKNWDEHDGKEYGGFYTQEEVKEVVAYAAARHITVIPEIEMPGHATAALAAYPEFGNNTGPYEVETKWGVFPTIFAPKEETFKFLEDVLTEVMDLFPSEYIHIGGDEAPKTEWEESEQAQAVIKREGLKDEHELQSYFISRIEKFLNENGRQIIGWDEILEGGLAPNATVMSWRGSKGGIEAARQGHDVVMTPNDHLYFDYYQSKNEDEPLGIGGFVPVEKVYSFNPVPQELSEEEGKHILGAQANLWTEYIKTTDHVEYMVLPRLTALAEVNWTPVAKKDWGNFLSRLKVMKERYEALDYNYAAHVFEEDQSLDDDTQE
ncbi:beta-N-acetylhexosaminidase [Salinimicrobium tongyeongense]|uniref:beta-N-acetylhexosaminidase n=1 Tax=Salinimicrobium tongyeongense TaxID=2809707 RepID=A0ABY6NSF8_9FLAO|nr:beta-N-acetylhexosaminidase [Salinimicrobium tongyeongense]UZH55423.1 beta-N-acetylhexosaminidase [Salinimicrobium tongyeongense]